ncbi:MAG: hypothetical protein ACRCYZ_06970 [Alphaproteobacteria bacterium]
MLQLRRRNVCRHQAGRRCANSALLPWPSKARLFDGDAAALATARQPFSTASERGIACADLPHARRFTDI